MIRGFYWDTLRRPRLRVEFETRLRGRYHGFGKGNAGDIFNRTLLGYLYPGHRIGNFDNGPRLLLVGSVAEIMKEGDLACGIGCRTGALMQENAHSAEIRALRGPLSYERLSKLGFNVRNVRFLLDPGLYIRFLLPERPAIPNRVIFIPHYLERESVRPKIPAWIRFVNIDSDPLALGRAIQSAELVYSSSLHGLVFAHALERPCVFVAPSSDELLFKFADYYLSVSDHVPKPLPSIDEATLGDGPLSPLDLSLRKEQFVWPAEGELRQRGIAV